MSVLSSTDIFPDLLPTDLIVDHRQAFNIYKAVNAREGFSRKDDKFPERWLKEPFKKGEQEVPLTDYFKAKTLTQEDVERLLDDYYEERGWDLATGIPTRRKLEELGLGYVADDLEKQEVPLK